MKREGHMGAFKEATKGGHKEKDLKNTSTADLKYSKYGDNNEKELAESVDSLANYVKKNRMKY